MGGSDYTAPVQPGYGDSMREALDAQIALLTGEQVGKSDFRGVGKMEDIVQKYEKPLRQTTAQVDTDVMRQTLLGTGSGEKYAEDGRIITGYESSPQEGQYKVVQDGEISYAGLDVNNNNAPVGNAIFTTRLIDTSTGKEVSSSESKPFSLPWDTKAFGEIRENGELPRPDSVGPRKIGDANTVFSQLPNYPDKRKYDFQDQVKDEYSEDFKEYLSQEQIDAVSKTPRIDALQLSNDGSVAEAKPIYKKDEKTGEDFYAPANTFKAGDEVRLGDGMVDLVGDKRNVQESVQGADGKFSLQDTGRQAGFDDKKQFMGLSAMAEDIGRGVQQRAREADIADVERLGGRATDAYRAQGNLGGALENARAMGAGGSDNLSAIPANPLFTGGALDSLGNRVSTLNQGIDAIGGGRMGDFDPRYAPPQKTIDRSAGAEYRPPLPPNPISPTPRGTDAAQKVLSGDEQIIMDSVFGPNQPQAQPLQPYQPAPSATGTDAFRAALMSDARGALSQGLTAREKENIEQASRARATALGRAFDTGSIEQEVQAKLLEDRNRQMQNRSYAQSVLGGEVGIQQADLARNLQAQQLEMGRQSQGVDRQLAAEESDVERAMRQQAMGEQFRQSGLGMERANAAQMVGLEQATSADPFQAILARQGQNTLGQGQGVFSQAGYGLQSAPQYIDPSAGLGFIQNQSANQASMYNAQIGADAAKTAGMWGGLGALGGGILGGVISR